MKTIPFITFITPTYNRELLINNTILSVINQKKDISFEREMIIIDDWSTDNTREIVERHIKQYPNNIKYFYQENGWIPGKARNVWLDHMNKKSNYTIFIDSDDELNLDVVYTCLKKVQKLKEKNIEEELLWFYFLCEDENHNVIGNKKILQWKKERYFDYHAFLKGEINIEMGIWLKSKVFLEFPKLRFSEIVVSEAVMRAKMRQYMEKNWLKLLLWDYVGRFYRLSHTTWDTRICKNISPKRFKNNAEGNKEVLKLIEKDLQKYWYKKVYADYLFKIGINYILCWEKTKWLRYIRKSLRMFFNVIVFWVYILALVSKRLVLIAYKLYI